MRLRLVVSAIGLLLSLATPASLLAASAPAPAAPAIVPDDLCTDTTINHRHYGASADLQARGVYAHIDPPTGMLTCSSSLGNDSVSVWIGLKPVNAPNDQAILQIGVINSNGPGGSGGTYLKYFWAQGGCNGDQALPEYFTKDGANPGWGNHIYRISRVMGDRYQLSIDGDVVKTIYMDDSRISCWIYGSKNPSVEGETFDGGDHFSYSTCPGCSGDTKVEAREFAWKDSNDDWGSWGFGPGNCDSPNTYYWDNRCGNTSSFVDGFNLYSVYIEH